MSFTEKLTTTQEKMDEIKARMSASAERTKMAQQMKREEIAADIAAVGAELDALDTAITEQMKSDIEDIDAALDLIDEAVDAKVDDDIATLNGIVNAAKENYRLAKERRDSRINTMKLKASMNINAAKARIAERKEAKDRAKQEQRIIDLLYYADSCQQLALVSALEAELAILEAAAEAADYVEKYGTEEDA